MTYVISRYWSSLSLTGITKYQSEVIFRFYIETSLAFGSVVFLFFSTGHLVKCQLDYQMQYGGFSSQLCIYGHLYSDFLLN